LGGEGALRYAVRVPRIDFTPHLRRHVDCPRETVPGNTVRDALEAYFAAHPLARSYVLDEQGTVRKHVVLFVDGVMLRDRERQADAVGAETEIFVMQALSGG
jgi:molybdopterin synthase sulfur carrier subunit